MLISPNVAAMTRFCSSSKPGMPCRTSLAGARRHDRDAVVGLLSAERCAITRGLQLRAGEPDVLVLGFLQADDVGRVCASQSVQLPQAHLERVDVPGREPHTFNI